MAETTEQYRARINQLKTSIENEPLIKKMRDDIAEGISKTGNRQADIEVQFQSVIDGTTGKDVISAPELIAARNGEANLNARLTKKEQEVATQFAQIENEKASINYLDAILMDIAKGGPQGPFMSLAALYAYDFPSGKTGTWLVFDTSFGEGAHSFMWDSTNSIWKDLGVYQGTGIANGTVTNPKYAERSITPNKTTFVSSSSNSYDKTKDSVGKVISISGEVIDNADYSLSEPIYVTPGSSVFIYSAPSFAEFDEQGRFIKRVSILDNEGLYVVSNQTHSIRVNFQPTITAMYGSARVNMGSKKTYEPFWVKIDDIRIGNKNIEDASVSTQKVQNKAITSDKRTDLGSSATLTPGLPFILPNIDLVNMRLQLFGNTYVTYKKSRFDIAVGANSITNIDFSSIWQNGGLVPIIYFNTITKTFNVYALNDLVSVTEDDIFVMVIYKNSDTMEFFGATCNFDYTVNGRKPKKQEKNYYFVPDNLVGMVKMPEGLYDTEQIDSPLKLNQKISELTATNSGYMKHTLLGKDASGTHDIYKLSLTPKRLPDTDNKRDVPKIVFISGVHGGEKGSVYATYYFIKALCENWKDNALLEYLRFNIRFEIVYLTNPWGFSDENNKAETWWGRYNANHVDINRNMPFKWTPGVIGSSTYSGLSAGSEIESQYLKQLIDDNKDAIHMFDYHTNGSSGAVWDTLTYIDVPEKPVFDYDVTIASRYQIEKFTREATKDYNLEPDTDFLGFIHRSPANGRVDDYAQSVGLPSLAIETWRKFPHELDFYSSETIKASAEYLGSWIINFIRQYNQ